MNKIYTIIFACLFLACSHERYSHEVLKNEILAYTKEYKGDFIAIGTYLNPIHQEISSLDSEFEHFILTIYPNNPEININNAHVNNEKANLEILDNNDTILNLTAFKIPWSKNYKITTPSKKSDILKLSFEYDINGTSQQRQVSLSFQKIAKSLYWNAK